MVEKAIDQMKKFELMETVNDATTHVVCGDPRRTLNVMRGVVRGSKIVSFSWVLLLFSKTVNIFKHVFLLKVTESMAEGKWLNEDDYPVERFSAAASLYRTNKRVLFEKEIFYVSSRSKIPSRDLCELIKCAGGELTNVSKKASIIVGHRKPQVNVPCVSGTWILDCIEKGLTLPLTNYLIPYA